MVVKDFGKWFNERTLSSLEWVEEQVERHLENGEFHHASSIIDWLHGFWAEYHTWEIDGVKRHIAGPYCRVSLQGYKCRAMEAEAGNKPGDPQPTLEDAS